MKLPLIVSVFLTTIDCHNDKHWTPTLATVRATPSPRFWRSPSAASLSWPTVPPRFAGGGERGMKSHATSTDDDWSPGVRHGHGWMYSASDERIRRSMPRKFLYGVTYYPWRRRKNCSEISEDNVRQDFKFIASVARNVQIFELYCNLTPIIVRLAREEDLGLLMGISISDEAEYDRQKAILETVLRTYNTSHILGVTVGRTSLFNATNQDWILGKVHEISTLVGARNSSIPVSMISDSPADNRLAPTAVNVVSAYPRFRDSKPASFEDFVSFYESWFADQKRRESGNKKGNIYTEFGYPIDSKVLSATYRKGEPFPVHGGGGGPPTPSVILLENLSCFRGGAPDAFWKRPMPEPEPFWKKPIPEPEPEPEPGPEPEPFSTKHGPFGPPSKLPDIRYFYHSAFDMPFEYGDDDPRAHWGLADADTREMKKPLMEEIAKRAPGGFPKFGICMDMLHAFEKKHDDKGKFEINRQWIAIGASLSLAVLAVTAMIVLLCHRHRVMKNETRKRKMLQEQLEANTNSSNAYIRTLASYLHRSTESYVDLISKSDYENLSALVGPEWLIEETAIRFEEIIGEGHFGIVQRGTLTRYGETVDVAVKRLHVGAKNVRQFLSEGILMEQFHHPNILPLVGISFTSYYLPMIITPFMQKGDLLSFVKNGENRLTVRQLLKFGLEIAEGMAYMHSLKLIHRDLAARNCMLDDTLTVKIADFGLCRDVSDSDSYQTARASDIPIRWMPPETIEKLEWTNKSDVWSYGVVLWELFTRGKQPYTRVPLVELRAFLRSGGRLQKPDGCPDVMYDLMKNCWHGQAEQRPSFAQLCDSIPALVQALEGEQILDLPDYYNALTVMEMSQQPVPKEQTERNPEISDERQQ